MAQRAPRADLPDRPLLACLDHVGRRLAMCRRTGSPVEALVQHPEVEARPVTPDDEATPPGHDYG
jgi:hypothetical protein